MRWIRRIVSLGPLAAALLLGCLSVAPVTEAEKMGADMDAREAGEVITRYMGRIHFGLPERLELMGATYRIYNVSVDAIALESGQTAAQQWGLRRHDIQQLPAPEGLQSAIVRELRIDPDTPAVFYHARPDDRSLIVVEAQRSAGEHVLSLRYEGLTAKQAEMERLLQITVAGFVPGSTEGFCVGAGALTSKPSLNEQASMHLTDARRGLAITISTRTVGDVPEAHPLDDIEEEQRAFAEDGMKLEVLLDADRTAGGLQGKEGRVRFSSEEDAQVRFTWFYPGVSRRSQRPLISIEATAPPERMADLEQVWEILMNSLAPSG